nr:hypothetical protein [Bacteroidales bacterium]
ALIGYMAGAGVYILQKNIFPEQLEEQKSDAVKVRMTPVDIRNYLTENTFYIVENRPNLPDVKDSSIVRFFCIDRESPIPYYGTHISTYCTQRGQLEIYNKSVDLNRGKIIINSTVGDTMAPVQYGNRELVVTQSGRVFFVTTNGAFPLNRMKE